MLEPAFFLSFAVVLVAVIAPMLFARRRAFSYAVLYDGRFEAVEAEGEAAGDEVRVVAVEIRNSSGLNVERPHYVRPVTVGFGEGARILDAEIVEEDPPGIEATLRGLPERDPEKVALAPVLLNDGDAVLLEIVVANSGGIEVDGRMVGIKRIVDRSRSTIEKTTLAVANGIPALVAVAVLSLYSVVAGDLDPAEYFSPETLNLMAGVLAGLVLADVLLALVLYTRWSHKTRVRRRVLARRLGEPKGG